MARKVKKCPACDGSCTDHLQRPCELCEGMGTIVTYDATDIVPLEYLDEDKDPDTESDDRGYDRSAHTEDDDI